jgi:16S rRNA processing protein RimM
MREYFEVGIISGMHGLKGEVKIYTTSQDPARFEDLDTVLLDLGNEKLPLEIERVRYSGIQPLLKFKGYDRIEDVEKWKGRSLCVSRENALPLEENEYYVGDLIGCRVLLEDGKDFGTLTDVRQTGANDVYTVRMASGKEVLIPAIDSCIREVSPEKGEIRIHLLEGLLD